MRDQGPVLAGRAPVESLMNVPGVVPAALPRLALPAGRPQLL
jgi:hypothetical protein